MSFDLEGDSQVVPADVPGVHLLLHGLEERVSAWVDGVEAVSESGDVATRGPVVGQNLSDLSAVTAAASGQGAAAGAP